MITASHDELFRQAILSAHEYASAHTEFLRQNFPKITNAQILSVLPALCQVSATDFATAIVGQAIFEHGDALRAVAEAIDRMGAES